MGKCRIEKDHWLLKTPVAHRGLHSPESGVPENSMKAYAAAIENGYPIEMDIQLTKDNVLVCFHDDTLSRMTGVDAFVRDKTFEEVRAMRLAGTDEIIPTFDEFLAFVGAHNSALDMETARVIKSVRNDTNRRVNAEIANQQKTAHASMQQIAKIRQVVEKHGIESIPQSLREVALLRLKYPDASIKELGELADPPLSKNAVYHRLRRINAMLDE